MLTDTDTELVIEPKLNCSVFLASLPFKGGASQYLQLHSTKTILALQLP